MPAGGKDRESLTIVTPKGVATPTHVPQGVLNATAYFQATLQRKLEELNYLVWVDDIVMWRTDFDDLLRNLDAVLGRLERMDLYAI